MLANGIDTKMSKTKLDKDKDDSKDIDSYIETSLKDNKVMIFSVSWLDDNKAKKLLQKRNIKFKRIELNKLENGEEIFRNISHNRAKNCGDMPFIFINGVYLGGISDLETAANNGYLNELNCE